MLHLDASASHLPTSTIVIWLAQRSTMSPLLTCLEMWYSRQPISLSLLVKLLTSWIFYHSVVHSVYQLNHSMITSCMTQLSHKLLLQVSRLLLYSDDAHNNIHSLVGFPPWSPPSPHMHPTPLYLPQCEYWHYSDAQTINFLVMSLTYAHACKQAVSEICVNLQTIL